MAHIAAALTENAEAWGNTPVWHCSGRASSSASAETLLAAAASLSAALSSILRCSIGSRVALLALNTPEYFVALLAAADAGALACPLNWRWSAAELAAALALIEPTALFVDVACVELLQSARRQPECPLFTVVLLDALDSGSRSRSRSSSSSSSGSSSGSDSATAAAAALSASQPPPCRRLLTTSELLKQRALSAPALQQLQPPDGAALICFTSGTTSAPKGAVLTHAALMHQSRAKLATVGCCQQDVYLHVAPLFHIGGLSSGLAALLAGARHVFMPRCCFCVSGVGVAR